MKIPELIGISGSLGGGKDSLASVLSDKFGCTVVSTGDLVREVASQERGSIERPVLREVANEYRQKFGAGYFVELALSRPRPLILTGIRSLGEMKAIKSAGGIILFIDAPIELRYQRMISRARDDEVRVSLEDFREREEKEMHSGDSDTDFNIRAIGEQADITIINDSNFESFVEAAIARLTS